MKFNTLKLITVAGVTGIMGLVYQSPVLAGDGDKEFRPSHNGCSKYRISVYGGDGALRLMSNPNDLRRTSNGSSAGKFCTSGRVRFELAKRNVSTHIKFNINGKKYHFGEGDRGHKHLKGWYRKYIDVKLPHRTSHNQRSQNHSYANNGGYNNHGYQRRNNNHGYQQRNNRYSQNNDYAYNQYDDGHRYNDYHQNNQYGYHSNSQRARDNYGYGNKPWFSSHSRKHRKAHKRGKQHVHRGDFFAFH